MARARRSELVKAHALAVADAAGHGETAQPPEFDGFTPEEALPPPIDPELLAGMTLLSPLRRSCIRAIVSNTVGLGFACEPREGHEDDTSQEGARALEAHLNALTRADERMGRPSFTRLGQAVKWDEQEVGQGVFEVSRNTITGQVDGLYHLPGKRIRRRRDRKGWIMGPRKGGAETRTRFYDFGDKVRYTDEGMPTATLRAGRRWAVNEVIVLRLYTSESRDYGLPPDVQLALDYTADRRAVRANEDYFAHSGVPPTVLFVQGTESRDGKGGVTIEVPPEFTKRIAGTLRTGKRGDRVAVVPLPGGTKAEAIDLSHLSDRDLGHVEFRRDNRRRTLGAWRLSPIFVADIEDAGYSTADAERKITKEQVFDPEQASWEDQFEALLNEIEVEQRQVPNVLGRDYALAYRELRMDTDEARRESANDLADRGKITNGELREAHGYGPMPEAKPGQDADTLAGEMPNGWNDELVTRREVAIPQMGTPDSPIVKAATLETELGEQVEDVFDAALDDAIASITAATDDGEVRPVVIEKGEDGAILVRPYPLAALPSGE